MALTRGTTSGSIFDPLFDFSAFDLPLAILGGDNSRNQFAKDVTAVANTRVDWMETPEAHVFKADLPGLAKEEIKVHIEEGRVLEISGERKKEQVDKSDKYHRVERAHGSFLRRFKLPEDANVEAVKAEVSNGVLTVTVPKIPKSQPRSIQVN